MVVVFIGTCVCSVRVCVCARASVWYVKVCVVWIYNHIIYMYIYIYVCVCARVCIYIYISYGLQWLTVPQELTSKRDQNDAKKEKDSFYPYSQAQARAHLLRTVLSNYQVECICREKNAHKTKWHDAHVYKYIYIYRYKYKYKYKYKYIYIYHKRHCHSKLPWPYSKGYYSTLHR